MSASPWTTTRHQHRVVIPVLDLDAALPAFGAAPDVRRALALAFAADTIAAASRARLPLEVVVATPDPIVQAVARKYDARVLPACAGEDLWGLTESAREAAHREGLGGPTALLASTLPCLLPTELDAALMTRGHRGVQFLDLGNGRHTLRTETDGWPEPAPPYVHETPQQVLDRLRSQTFLPGLACDVTTIHGLRIAAFLGVGPATQAAIDEFALLPAVRTWKLAS